MTTKIYKCKKKDFFTLLVILDGEQYEVFADNEQTALKEMTWLLSRWFDMEILCKQNSPLKELLNSNN